MTLITFTLKLAELLWSPVMIVLCFGVAVYYSVVLKFPQIRYFKGMLKSLSRDQISDSGITPFQSFAMSLGNRVGIGVIAGVATAIAYGGPGSIFWMWMYTLLGAASAFGESVLGQLWKEEVNGEYRGGPAYYLKKCPGPLKCLGFLSAIGGLLVFGFTGPAVQTFNIASSVNNAFGVPQWISGVAVVAIFAIVVFGGMKRVAGLAELLVPFMSAIYMVVTVIILVANAKAIPAMFVLIFKSAFNMEAAFGGMMGSAIAWGIKRSIFSSEAGMGSGANAAASAEVSHPIKQGIAQAFSIYCTTFVCTCTALMILVTGAYNVIRPDNTFAYENLPGIEAGTGYTQAAVDTIANGTNLGAIFVAIALFLFALTTILAQGFFVQISISSMFDKSKVRVATLVVAAFQLFAIFFGSINASELIWNFSDIGNGILTWLNLIGMIFLLKPVALALKDYEQQQKAGLEPVFIPSKTEIEGAELWNSIVERNYKDINSNKEIKK